jgi:hypothetical protein
MTEAEVELIYEYLHENYEYRDGELIAKHDVKYSKRKGQRIGAFDDVNGTACLKVCLKIKSHHFYISLAQAIYLFHKKIFAPHLLQLDRNRMNTRFENLKPSCLSEIRFHNISNRNTETGFPNVRASKGKFIGRFAYKNKRYSTKAFDTPEEAHAAYLKAKEEYASK